MKRSKSKRIENINSNTKDDSTVNKVSQSSKTKGRSKQLKVKRKINDKKKRGRPPKPLDSSCETESIDTNLDGIDAILTDLERKFNYEKNERNNITQTLACDHDNISIKVDDILHVQGKSNVNKTKQPCNENQVKDEQIDGKLLEEYKKRLLEKIEKNEKPLISISEQKCSPKHSTPSMNADCPHMSPKMQTNSSDGDNNDNTSVKIEDCDTHLEESIDSCNQCVLSESKKRKIVKNGDENVIESKNDVSYSTQDESMDDSFEKVPSTVEHVLNSQKSSMKRKRGNRRYRKKNKDKNRNLLLEDSDKAETESEKTFNSASNLEDDFGILDIGVENTDEVIQPEDIRYIPVDFHDDFHGILLLAQNQVVAMKGFMQLTVVSGEVDISGYRMVAGQVLLPYVDVFSVTNTSLFYIKDVTLAPCSVEFKEKLVTDLATTFQSTKEKMAESLGDIQEVYSCVVVKKLYSVLPALLKKLDNFKAFPREPKFVPQPFYAAVLETDHWGVLFNKIQSEMTKREDDCLCSIMLCGGKNVGKSSLSRYSINRMLEKHSTVFYLDCDCGQSEFTPASVLSLVKVTKPLLGLPFSHQLMPVNSYFYGHISPGETPSEYIKLIGYLFQTYYVDYYPEGPLVINTQGWMQGLGLSLLVDCIRLMSPCHIIHIHSPTEKNNVPKQLSDELLESEEGWDIDSAYKCIKNGHGCKYHNLCTTDVQMNFKLGRNKSREARNQCITSYFSTLYQPYLDHSIANGENYSDWIPPSMSVLMPYIVRWQDVALHIMHEKVTPDVMLFGFNLALVGLARVEPELIKARKEDSKHPNYLLNQPVAEFIGFGIIRNIDETKKLFYILTPEPVDRLKTVNALLKGSAQLPTTYFLEETEDDESM